MRLRRFVLLLVALNAALWLVWALFDRSSDGLAPWPLWISAVSAALIGLRAAGVFDVWPEEPNPDRELAREMRRLQPR